MKVSSVSSTASVEIVESQRLTFVWALRIALEYENFRRSVLLGEKKIEHRYFRHCPPQDRQYYGFSGRQCEQTFV